MDTSSRRLGVITRQLTTCAEPSFDGQVVVITGEGYTHGKVGVLVRRSK